jgi:hypothetical protein
MATHILSAYVLPGDIAVDPKAVVEKVNAFISSRHWLCPDAWAVHQQRQDEEGELGLNLALPELGNEPVGWFDDVLAIVSFCVELRREIGRDFVVSIADQTGLADDIIEIASDSPNTEHLKQFIGIEPPKQLHRRDA